MAFGTKGDPVVTKGTDRPAPPPGAARPKRFLPRLHYELLACGIRGHELMGTDVRELRPEDALVARGEGNLRWYRCLRCDSWLPLTPPSRPSREHMPARQDVRLPLRGKPLRDKIVLRLIAIDRALHFLILSAKRLFGLRGGGDAERAERERDMGWQALERSAPGAAQGPGDSLTAVP